MTWEVAKRAVEYARDNSGAKVAISFYGGEPLVQFELIFGDRKEFTMQECFACFTDMKYKNVISNTK